MLFSLIRKKDGQALVQFAVMISVIIGLVALVADVGGMYLTKAQLQRMADSGAIAGAAFLPNTDVAETTAISYVEKNTLPSYSLNPDVYDVDADASTGYKIKVTVSRDPFFGFAQVLGIVPQKIQASATASRTGGISGLFPWALYGDEANKYQTGDSFVIKDAGGGGIKGWFGISDFPGQTSPNLPQYKDNLWNQSGQINIGDWLFLPTGNKGEAGDKAIETIKKGPLSNPPLNQDQDYSLTSYENVKLTDNNVVFIPEIDADQRVIGFAALYITSFGNPNGIVNAVFLNDTFFTGTNNDVNSFFKTRLEYD